MRYTRNNIIGGIVAVFLFGVLFGFVRAAIAEGSPDPNVSLSERAIQANQKWRQEDKKEEFADCEALYAEEKRKKDANAFHSGVLSTYDYRYDWELNKAVPDFQ